MEETIKTEEVRYPKNELIVQIVLKDFKGHIQTIKIEPKGCTSFILKYVNCFFHQANIYLIVHVHSTNYFNRLR
jgi:hypothetical protein